MLFYFCQRLLAHQGLVFLNPLPSCDGHVCSTPGYSQDLTIMPSLFTLISQPIQIVRLSFQQWHGT